MKNRKAFLVALGATGAALALRAEAHAQSAATPSPAPSSLAMTAATAMRRFDARLTDAQIETIARGIDDNTKAAATLDPKKRRLRNSDEPVTTFVIPFS